MFTAILLFMGLLTTPTRDKVYSETDANNFNYVSALQKSLYFYDSQFSGVKPSWSESSWRGDCNTLDGKEEGLDLTGSFQDCGDSIYFGAPYFFSMRILAWSAIEYKDTYVSTGQLNHLMNILDYGYDFAIRAHPEPNVLWIQCGNGEDHNVWVPCEFNTAPRPCFQINTTVPGADVAGQASAFFSAGYILYKDTNRTRANILLKHAIELFNFAEKYPGRYSDRIPEAGAFYSSSQYNDKVMTAALWLYRATSETIYSDYAHKNSRELVKQVQIWTETWDSSRNGNVYLLCKLLNDPDACFQTENYLEFWAGKGYSTYGNIQYTPGGMAFLTVWNSARYTAITSFLALLYVDNTPDLALDKQERYVNFAKSQFDYLLGKNPRNMSYLTGYGNKYPQRIHHRGAHGSSTNSMDSPDANRHVNFGIIGPDANDNNPDIRSDYVLTETGMDMVSSFVCGISAMASRFGGHPVVMEPETRGLEFFVNSTIQKQNEKTAQGTFFFVGQSGWPPRSPDLMFKIFFPANISGLSTISYYNQNATISSVGHCSSEWDYLNVSFGAGFIYPGSTTSSIKQVQIAFSSNQVLDLSGGWSFKGVDSKLVMNPNIPVYEKIKDKWVKQYGNEPICVEGYKPFVNKSNSSIELIELIECSNKEWSQCSGKEFSGQKCCMSGLKCVITNEYYGQCQKDTDIPAQGYWKCFPCTEM